MPEINTTRQEHLFPINPPYAQLSRAEGDFASHLRQQLFNIKDDLLYGLITYGDGMASHSTTLPGLTWSKNSSYGILVFLVSRALNLYRLPFTPDRIFTSHLSERGADGIEKILRTLTPARVEIIVEEICALYTHTQAKLAQAGLAEVLVTRRIYDDDAQHGRAYATQIARRKVAAEHTGKSIIKFEMDTLNSFGDDGGYSHFPVTLEFRVPASDVLYCANFIASRDADSVWTGKKHAVEPGEWMVINRAPDGVVEIPLTQVHVNNKLFEDRYKSRIGGMDPQMSEDSAIVLRSLSHLKYDYGFGGFGFEPKWFQRILGAITGMVRGALRGYRQGFYK